MFRICANWWQILRLDDSSLVVCNVCKRDDTGANFREIADLRDPSRDTIRLASMLSNSTFSDLRDHVSSPEQMAVHVLARIDRICIEIPDSRPSSVRIVC